MDWMIMFTRVLSVVAFFVVVGLCIAYSFGFLKKRAGRRPVNKMFAISVVAWRWPNGWRELISSRTRI